MPSNTQYLNLIPIKIIYIYTLINSGILSVIKSVKDRQEKTTLKSARIGLRNQKNLASYIINTTTLKDKEFAQHPSTWLNAEGFLNEEVLLLKKKQRKKCENGNLIKT